MEASAARSRWPDDRVDDLAKRVERLQGTRDNVIELATEVRGYKEDLDALFASFRQHRDELRKDAEARRIERKADLRWVLATVFTTAMLIIAAVGLLFG